MQLNLKNILFLEIFLGRVTSHFKCILTIVHEHNLTLRVADRGSPLEGSFQVIIRKALP